MKAISARDLSKTYFLYEKRAGLGGSLMSLVHGRKVRVEAVRKINLDMEIGEIVGFVGPNGAGKTTTLKMLSGILHPTHGDVNVLGFIPAKREKNFLKKISFVSGQRNRLFWDLPAEEFFEFWKIIYEVPEGVYTERLRSLVELLEIEDILRVPQRKLSFGQRKRCELVATLLHDPQVIFLDEPTNGLDLVNAKKVREFVRRLGKNGKHTILITSHNMSDIEELCERLMIINQGGLVFDGRIRDLQRVKNYRKQIRVVFEGPWRKEEAERLGRILEAHDEEVILEVEPDQAPHVVSHLVAVQPVKDISISEPKLETVIESFFSKGQVEGCSEGSQAQQK
jgi:ABC-2 type transport system ATP-binding protein